MWYQILSIENEEEEEVIEEKYEKTIMFMYSSAN